jgi:putative endonuclease
MFYVYILECSDKTLYVGSTNDLDKRIYAHNNLKSGAHYTKVRRPVVLKYHEKLETYGEARKRERELKRLTRKEKLNIISKFVTKKPTGRLNFSEKRNREYAKKNIKKTTRRNIPNAAQAARQNGKL